MKATHIQNLINKAIDYTLAYAKQYNITDGDLLRMIFNSHLVYLYSQYLIAHQS